MNAMLCPKCGSGKVQTSGHLLEGAVHDAECSECGWRGKDNELVTYDLDKVRQGLDSGLSDAGTAIAMAVSADYMNKLAQFAAQPIGLAMVESGLISKNDTKVLARLLRAACLGAHKATLDELEQIQREHQNDRRGTQS